MTDHYDDTREEPVVLEPAFEAVLADCIVGALIDIFGQNGARAIQIHLRLEKPIDVETVHSKMSGLLGVGSMSVERTIIDELYRRRGLVFPVATSSSTDEFDFVMLVSNLSETAREE